MRIPLSTCPTSRLLLLALNLVGLSVGYGGEFQASASEYPLQIAVLAIAEVTARVELANRLQRIYALRRPTLRS